MLDDVPIGTCETDGKTDVAGDYKLPIDWILHENDSDDTVKGPGDIFIPKIIRNQPLSYLAGQQNCLSLVFSDDDKTKCSQLLFLQQQKKIHTAFRTRGSGQISRAFRFERFVLFQALGVQL